MSAVESLNKLIKLDPSTARIVYTGLGLLAAATLVLGWQTSPDDMLPLAGWISAFGLILTVLSHIIKAPMMRATLCWMLIAMIGFGQLYLISAMFPNSPLQQITGRVAPLTCVLRGQFDLTMCVEALAPLDPSAQNTGSSAADDAQVWLAQAPAAPPGTTVYLQFADPVTRDQSISIGATLLAAGWGVQAADRGGEQVKAAPDANEVRFFNAPDEAAARALASSLEPLTGTPVGVRDMSRLYRMVKDGQLEIWLSTINPPGVTG